MMNKERMNKEEILRNFMNYVAVLKVLKNPKIQRTQVRGGSSFLIRADLIHKFSCRS